MSHVRVEKRGREIKGEYRERESEHDKNQNEPSLFYSSLSDRRFLILFRHDNLLGADNRINNAEKS